MMIKTRMKQGEFVLGTWCDIPSAVVINIMAKAGFNFVIIDMEHGPMDYTLAQDMIMAAECAGCEAIVGVPRNDEAYILRALDIGASGIIVPQIQDIEDRKRTVSFSKFSPTGIRGFNPYVRAGAYNNRGPSYFNEQNNRVLVGISLEGTNAIRDLDNIIDDPDVDLVYIGTYDLSAALGIPGDVKNKIVVESLENAVKKIRAKGKSAGCMIHNVDDLKRFKKLGIQFITFKVDTAIIYDSCKQIRNEFEKLLYIK